MFIGFLIISCKGVGCGRGVTREYARGVGIDMFGLMMTMFMPVSVRLQGVNMLPMPVARRHLLWIKKGQSAPSVVRRWIIWESDRLSWNCLLSIFIMCAASDEPPPRPAPEGIALSRVMCRGGIVWSCFKLRRARTTRFLSGGQSVGRGLPVRVYGVFVSAAGRTCSVSERGIG